MVKTANQNQTVGKTSLKSFDLVATTAHELKSPLTVISGLAEMLAAGQFGKLNPQQVRYVERIHSVSGRLINLVESLLTINRAQYIQARLQPISLSTIISQVAAELTPRLNQSRMRLSWKRRRVEPVLVDSQFLYQIVYNLLDNAIKYSPPKTTITIKFRHQAANLYLRISDQGVGVKPNELKHLYQRFGRRGQPINSQAGSTGLGLYIVKRLVEAHGGRLRAKALKRGTCFIVRLPLAQQLNLFKP